MSKTSGVISTKPRKAIIKRLCPQCGGVGYFYRVLTDDTTYNSTVEMCPMCKGVGEI